MRDGRSWGGSWGEAGSEYVNMFRVVLSKKHIPDAWLLCAFSKIPFLLDDSKVIGCVSAASGEGPFVVDVMFSRVVLMAPRSQISCDYLAFHSRGNIPAALGAWQK